MSAPPRLSVVLAVLALVSACSGATATEGGPTDDTLAATDFVGAMTLEPSRGPAGTTVAVAGEGLPGSADLRLVWGTVTGNWVIQGERGEEYHGRTFAPTNVDLDTVRTDESGSFTTAFEVPEDFGFAHDVMLVDGNGVIRNQAMFDVEMSFSVTPTEGPPGTPITIEVWGMGWQTLENSRTVVYDNAYTGWMSAVTTNGYARAVIPATGTPGEHQIGILRGAYTFPYLNPDQSPRPDIPVFETTFTVTDDDPILPAPIEAQAGAPQPRSDGDSAPTSGAWVTTDMLSGPVGTPLTVSGGGVAAGDQVDIDWFRIVGNRVSGEGWGEESLTLGTAVADDDGSFELSVVVPGDVGGEHRIEAVADGETVAITEFLITPAAMPSSTAAVPWGTEIVIELTGVGWTETANIYTLVYDNTYLGYACGFNSQGDVVVTLTATGEPGWHFIDLYPAIYKGKESPGQQNFRIPQLTYEADHPGEDLPAFRYAFYLEG